MKSIVRWIFACCLIAFCNIGFAQRQNAKLPNVIWITCEDISPYIGAFGNDLVKTPNIDQLAKEGVKYTSAYTVAGVCSPSRSAIITGMYPTAIGTQHMRTMPVAPIKLNGWSPNYSAVLPENVKAFPEYLRMQGYFTSNNEKTDYQFIEPVTVWDENGPAASYSHRTNGKPFFSVFNLFITHESQLFSRKDSLTVDPAKVQIPPYLKDTPTSRRDMARLLTNIEAMDRHLGEVIQQLKKDGVYENSYIFFFSDHGGALPWMKREVLERGTHIPLIVRLPNGEKAGTVNEELISAVDFAPTVLAITGTPVPNHLQGQAFLGEKKAKMPRKYVYAARDRMDEKYDRVRSVRDKQFRYIYNYMPEQPAYQDLAFRRNVATMKEMLQLHEAGKLEPAQEAWFKSSKPVEELYDVQNDPHELHNLANEPAYAAKLAELRNAFRQWEKEVGDMSAVSEKEMVANWWKGADAAPVTAKPAVNMTRKGAMISCDTKGASIGYRVVKNDKPVEAEKQQVNTHDLLWVMGRVKNGEIIEVKPVWQVYTGQAIPLQKGEKLLVQAMRIGYAPSTAEYIQHK